MGNKRIVVFKGVLWFLAGLAAAVALIRFTFGLGVSTALSDTTPWGLWIGFDVMGGVALAAGGFVMAALVHIFHRHKYHAAARPAILTAFLGYAAVAVGLLFDLGLPWHIWHPMFFWNVRSPLFEVAWCVMLYLTVLALEVAPTILEKTKFQRTLKFFTKLALPIMILGIMLSTLHQSSLGTMLLIMPFRLHPLWYTPMLPELFFVSAICLGLCMVMFESSTTSWLYRRKPESEMLEGLSKLASIALALYLAFRIGDLAFHGKLGLAFDGSWMGNLFLVEMALSAALPMVLFAVPRVRRSFTGVWLISLCSVLGFVLNRINASGLSQVWATDVFYFPAWTEFAISLGIVSGCAIVFFFIQEHFPVDPHGLQETQEQREAAGRAVPRFSPFSQIWLGEGWRKAARVYSMLFVLALALGLTLAPKSEPVAGDAAVRARGGAVLRIGASSPYVYFDHLKHQEKFGKADSCRLCHHLHLPGDVGTPCSECHRASFEQTEIFDHTSHVSKLEGNRSCVRCHEVDGKEKLLRTKSCEGCHAKETPMMAANPVVRTFKSGKAVGYRDAVHGMCIPCHREKAKDAAVARPDLDRCGACHNEGTQTEGQYMAALAKGE